MPQKLGDPSSSGPQAITTPKSNEFLKPELVNSHFTHQNAINYPVAIVTSIEFTNFTLTVVEYQNRVYLTFCIPDRFFSIPHNMTLKDQTILWNPLFTPFDRILFFGLMPNFAGQNYTIFKRAEINDNWVHQRNICCQ